MSARTRDHQTRGKTVELAENRKLRKRGSCYRAGVRCESHHRELLQGSVVAIDGGPLARPSQTGCGEIMLRLSPPGREPLLQMPKVDMWLAGAEANVATQLARHEHDVGVATIVPNNDLGRSALTTLRGRGVDTSTSTRGRDRMGLYFATSGAGSTAGCASGDDGRHGSAPSPMVC